MLKLLDGYPDNVLAVSAEGEVTAEDYRAVLIPEGEARIKRNGKIRLLYLIGDDYDGFSPGAAWKDTAFGFAHMSELERVALVTDVHWIEDAVRLFKPFVHLPVKCFATADLDKGHDWIVASEV